AARAARRRGDRRARDGAPLRLSARKDAPRARPPRGRERAPQGRVADGARLRVRSRGRDRRRDGGSAREMACLPRWGGESDGRAAVKVQRRSPIGSLAGFAAACGGAGGAGATGAGGRPRGSFAAVRRPWGGSAGRVGSGTGTTGGGSTRGGSTF